MPIISFTKVIEEAESAVQEEVAIIVRGYVLVFPLSMHLHTRRICSMDIEKRWRNRRLRKWRTFGELHSSTWYT
jgi:hypothetical protein